MIDINQIIQRIKFVKLKDLLSIFPMLLGYIASLFFKQLHKNLWLICERENEARDNGYWFFKYMCENHPEIEVIYAINRKGIDYKKVSLIGKTIQFGSLAHWMYYFTAKKNISSQKEGKPNAALCFILEVYLGARKNRIYLKHGITKDSQRWIYYDVSKISMICTAAKREQEFIRDNFGYSADSVKLVGLCRFDNLLSPHVVKRQILVIPTMREWLRSISSDTVKCEGTTDFCKSEYFITWNSLLINSELSKLLDIYNIDLLFYPHPAIQKYIHNFKSNNKRIKIAEDFNYDMQKLLMESAVLITDYSSIYFDFAYMEKPLIYYQFDYTKYRKWQYQEGYFSYKNDGFGLVTKDELGVIEELKTIIENDFEIEEKYKQRIRKFFFFHDCNNCKRVYEAILNM